MITKGVESKMNRIRNVKYQWLITYVILMLIPTVIFLSVLGVLEKSVRCDVYQADRMVLSTVKNELDTCFYSMKMTYMKLDYDSNVRKLAAPGLSREAKIQTASGVLTRTRETTVFDGLRQKIYMAFPDDDIAICSESGVADVESVTNISFDNLTYADLEKMLGDDSGDFYVIDAYDNGTPVKALAYIAPFPMTTAYKNSGIAVIWVGEDYFLGENGLLSSVADRDAALVDENGQIAFATSDKIDLDTARLSEGGYEKKGAVVSFISLDNADWYGAISAPRAVILQRLVHVKFLIVLGIFLCLICGAIGIILLLRRNYIPLQKLMEHLSGKNGRADITDEPEMNEYDVLHSSISRILDQTKQIQKTVDRQNKTLWETYLSRLLVGRYSPELLETIDEPHAFLSENFAVVLFETENVDKLFADTDMSRESRLSTAGFIITNIMEEIIGEQHCAYVVPHGGNFAAIISLAAVDGGEPLSALIKKGLDAIYSNFGLVIHAALSDVHKSYYGICEGCREAADILEYVDYSGKPNVIQLEDLHSVSGYYYPSETDSALKKALAAGDSKAACEIITEIFRQNPAVGGRVKHEHKYLLLRIISALFDATDEGVQYRYTADVMHLVEDGSGWTQAEEKLTSLVEKLCGESSSDEKPSSSSLTDRVKQYLDEHYTDNNISIQLMGDYFGMSPYYLSKLFKNELGVAFGDYLRRVRVDHVKKMIESDSAVKLKDAAAEAGFSDARALKRAFVQEEGILPSEYVAKLNG